jgi:hypothetical protein
MTRKDREYYAEVVRLGASVTAAKRDVKRLEQTQMMGRYDTELKAARATLRAEKKKLKAALAKRKKLPGF